MGELLNEIKVRLERCRADASNTRCLQASLLEVAAASGRGVKRLDREIPQARVSHKNLLRAVESGSSVLGLKVERVVSNPSFLEDCEIPESLKGRVTTVTGREDVRRPNLRVMAKKKKSGAFATHAECDNGSERSKRRIADLEKDGWSTGLVVEFGSKG